VMDPFTMDVKVLRWSRHAEYIGLSKLWFADNDWVEDRLKLNEPPSDTLNWVELKGSATNT
jgi:hypothetical protein